MSHKHSYTYIRFEDLTRPFCECGKAGKKLPVHTVKPYRAKDTDHIDCHLFNISGNIVKIPHSHLEVALDDQH